MQDSEITAAGDSFRDLDEWFALVIYQTEGAANRIDSELNRRSRREKPKVQEISSARELHRHVINSHLTGGLGMHNRIQDLLNHKSSDVWCIAGDATISEAAHRMRDHHIGTLIVVSQNETVGMLSEHDIVSGVLACDGNPDQVLVSAVMTAVPIVHLETTIEDAAALAAAAGAHQIVVLREDRVVGVIAAKEMTNWLNRDQAFQISDLTGYITGRASPPRDAVSLHFDEAPGLEKSCAYCSTTSDEMSWNLGVALCRSCSPPGPDRWSPYR